MPTIVQSIMGTFLINTEVEQQNQNKAFPDSPTAALSYSDAPFIRGCSYFDFDILLQATSTCFITIVHYHIERNAFSLPPPQFDEQKSVRLKTNG